MSGLYDRFESLRSDVAILVVQEELRHDPRRLRPATGAAHQGIRDEAGTGGQDGAESSENGGAQDRGLSRAVVSKQQTDVRQLQGARRRRFLRHVEVDLRLLERPEVLDFK